MIPFPLTFLLTDIVNEFYGTEGARRLTFVGLGVAVFVFAIINLSIALPTSPESPIPGTCSSPCSAGRPASTSRRSPRT